MRKTIALTGILILGVVGLAPAAQVTVAKSGGDHTTVQAGINAAGAGGTVTITDSGTYVEDVTVELASANVTVQAAAGQTPVIQAANAVNRAMYQAIGITSASDHFGFSVQAPCTLIGLTIENNDPGVNTHAVFGPLTATALVVHSPQVTVRNCTIRGPTSGLGSGDWATCLVVAFGTTPASAFFDHCEFSGGEYTVVDETFQVAMPTWVDSFVTLTGCDIQGGSEAGLTIDAGVTTATDCVIHDNAGEGVSCGGGTMNLVNCDLRDNANSGLALDFNDSFARPGDWPKCNATGCLIIRNGPGGGQDYGARVYNGWLSIDHSIIAWSKERGGVFLDDNNPAPAYLDMDYCDIYVPGQNCFAFGQDVFEQPVIASVKNSILVGSNGMLNPNAGLNDCNICFSDLWITGTAVQDVATSNNVSIEPLYVAPQVPARQNFRYYNNNLNVGEGALPIGSQGPLEVGKLRGRSWFLYE